MVLLLESLESMVDLIEVPEHVLTELGEPDVHLVEPSVDLGELAPQEFDELLVLGRGYGPYLSQVQTLFKCIDHWTSPERVARAKLRQVDQAARQGSHHPVRLLNGDRAELGTKLEDYTLNMLHCEGRHKARVFESVLGVTAGSADVLRRALRFPLSTAKGTGTLLSVWIV